jgi:multiple sugar transport system ATP-binding protein
MASIELINLHKRYGEQSVLNGINLKIQDGEFVSLVGESGSGKSTLLRTIAGLETHSSGEILIDGESAGHLLPRERKLAMVFQSYALYPHLSVFDNIAMPLRMQCKRLSHANHQFIAAIFSSG